MILARLKAAIREQNWFAVVLEVFIVVLGVVIGFQISGWGEARADRAKEQAYLHQLANDLHRTERSMIHADSLARPFAEAEAFLARAFYLAERPPEDSLLAWFIPSTYFDAIRPVLGTVEALITTGDLALIENDSLRLAITAYLDRSRLHLSYADRTFDDWVSDDRIVSVWFNRNDQYEVEYPPEVRDSMWHAEGVWAPPPDARDPFPIDVEAFLSDRETAFAANRKGLWRGIMRRLGAWMQGDAAALREAVEAELNR